jgi:hypothetical protein
VAEATAVRCACMSHEMSHCSMLAVHHRVLSMLILWLSVAHGLMRLREQQFILSFRDRASGKLSLHDTDGIWVYTG